MMRDIKSIPVLRPFIGLVIGILIEKWIAAPFEWQLICIFSSISILFLTLLFRNFLKPKNSWIPGIFVFLAFISAGMLSVCRLNHESKLITEISGDYWVGEVLTEPVVKGKIVRFEMSLSHDSIYKEQSKAQVSVKISNSFLLPRARQIIVIRTNPERISGPMNPGEFDYAAYLESMGILYRCFVKEGEWKIISTKDKITIKSIALKVKTQLWEKIENLEYGNKNLGVLYAISLGSKELLTPEIREAYAVTGAMHVLVVSGQHIALIWMVLSYIFIWLRDIPSGKYVQFLLITGLIWFYSFMTGITASVVRASGMFTLVSIGKIVQKESSIYNSLSVSAFFGLLISPRWLTDAGFQLSYIAVLSIVFFQPKISSLWEPKTWVIHKIWEISSVSIAAQIGTLPLTLFYFNRFPPWFILSNILVIPLVTIIMILFILMLLCMIIPFAFSILLKLILFLIGIMNVSLGYIERLPSPGMDMIYLTGFQMFWFIITLFGITFFIRYRKNIFIILGLTSVLILVSAGSLHKYKSCRQNEIILYSAQGKMMLGLVEGAREIFLHNAADTVDITGNFNFKCKPHILQNRINDLTIRGLADFSKAYHDIRMIPGNQNCFFRFNGKSILILNDPVFFTGMRSEKLLKTDILIVNNRVPKLWKGQKQLFVSEQLLISSAVSGKFTYKSSDAGIIHTDSIFDSRSLGAFRYSLEIDREEERKRAENASAF